MHIDTFRTRVLDFYAKNKRILPWRETINPYWVLLSEVMLQQTQVPRVVVKFEEFVTRFPTVHSLAAATLPQVLEIWQGLGYNRRGKFLYEAAKMLLVKYNGKIPKSVELVDELPGIGYATACAIVTYSYNLPTVFIETNIRRVFLHHFFEDRSEVADSEILPLVKEAVLSTNPRDWYYALMDYGTYLSKVVENPNRRSKHYTIQSKFEGSVRQVRGGLLRYFLKNKTATYNDLKEEYSDNRLEKALSGLVKDGIVVKTEESYSLQEK